MGTTFPYQIEGNGIFRGELTRDSGLGVGYAVVTLSQGSRTPAGSAIFQFTSGEAVISEAGVLAVQATTSARIFVDNVQTRTGVAIASVSNPATTVNFSLLNTSGTLFKRPPGRSRPEATWRSSPMSCFLRSGRALPD